MSATSSIPDWLVPVPAGHPPAPQSPPVPAPSAPAPSGSDVRALLYLTYEYKFEDILEELANGRPLKQILDDDVRPIDYQHLLRWIHADTDRESRYQEAQRIGTEMLAAECIEIADAEDSLEDVQRSKLRIETRQFVMGAWNRKRYGKVNQIENNLNINIIEAMEAAENRLNARTIEGEVVE
jgi:hypothetical protein